MSHAVGSGNPRDTPLIRKVHLLGSAGHSAGHLVADHLVADHLVADRLPAEPALGECPIFATTPRLAEHPQGLLSQSKNREIGGPSVMSLALVECRLSRQLLAVSTVIAASVIAATVFTVL